MSTEPECPKCKDKVLERLFTFWTHQNQLMWSRLQIIAVMQLGVFGGWYALAIKGTRPLERGLGAVVAALGVYFAYKMRKLIACDRAVRNAKRDAIRLLEKDYQKEGALPQERAKQLFPTFDGEGSGSDEIENMARFFVWANSVLLSLTLLKPLCRLGRWLFCGC